MENGVRVGCVLLAAGESKRFGNGDKLLAPLGGVPLIRRTLSAIPFERFAAVTAVARSRAVAEECARFGCPVRLYEGGPLSQSIREGLRALPEDLDGFLFLNADRPLLSRETLGRMLDLFAADRACCVRLSWKGIPSNPVLFPAAARDALLSLTGERGGASVIRGGQWKTVCTEALSEAETMDADDPAALERMERTLEHRSE